MMWNRADWLDLHGDQGCDDADEDNEDEPAPAVTETGSKQDK